MQAMMYNLSIEDPQYAAMLMDLFVNDLAESTAMPPHTVPTSEREREDLQSMTLPNEVRSVMGTGARNTPFPECRSLLGFRSET